MADFKTFMKKTGVVCVKTGKGIKTAAVVVGGAVKRRVQISKLKSKIKKENSKIKKTQLEIGQKFYELHKEDSEEALAEFCKTISDSECSIAAKKDAIVALKEKKAKKEEMEEATPEAEEVPAPEAAPVQEKAPAEATPEENG